MRLGKREISAGTVARAPNQSSVKTWPKLAVRCPPSTRASGAGRPGAAPGHALPKSDGPFSAESVYAIGADWRGLISERTAGSSSARRSVASRIRLKAKLGGAMNSVLLAP